MKVDVMKRLYERGHKAVFPELGCCDLVAVPKDYAGIRLMGVELERSPRNVIVNVRRDISMGCDIVLILASTPKVYDSCLKCLLAKLPGDLCDRVFISTVELFLKNANPFILSAAPLYSEVIRQKKGLCSPLFAAEKSYSLPNFQTHEENKTNKRKSDEHY